jgi:hypothetical protein
MIKIPNPSIMLSIANCMAERKANRRISKIIHQIQKAAMKSHTSISINVYSLLESECIRAILVSNGYRVGPILRYNGLYIDIDWGNQ